MAHVFISYKHEDGDFAASLKQQIEDAAMTDYEMVSLFVETNEALQSAFTNYVAVLSAFLIAGYLIADKLETRMVAIVITLFTMVVLQQGNVVIGFGHDSASLLGQISAQATEPSSSIGWHGGATELGAGLGAVIMRFSGVAVLIISYIGGLIFFFHQRRVGRAE